jgi:hypothetical protein
LPQACLDDDRHVIQALAPQAADQPFRNVDPRSTPERVFTTDPADELPQTLINLRPPYPIACLPAPKYAEASAMSAQDRLRLNDLDHSKKISPESGHHAEKKAVAVMESKPGGHPAHRRKN